MKKILSIILTVLMVWMVFPFTIFATESEEVTSILGYDESIDAMGKFADGITINNENILSGESVSINNSLQATNNVPIADGVYKIRNSYNGLYMSVLYPGYESGTNIVQAVDATTVPGMSDLEINQLFKVTYLGTYNSLTYYSIRPMTNSGLGLHSSYMNPDKVSVKTMLTSDNWSIDYTQCWAIAQNGSYFTMRNGPHNFNNYLSVPSSNSEDPITTSISVTNQCQWLFEPYTGSAIDVVRMSNFSLGVKVGTTFDYDAYMYSSQIKVNGPVTYSVANMDYTPTNKATINSNTGELTANAVGTIKVGVTYNNAPWSWWWIVEITTENGWRQVDMPSIQSRGDWGARPVAENRLVARNRAPERIIFHHSADKFSQTDMDAVIAEIQRIQNDHMDDEGKCDIAYHFIIDPQGRIWKGAEIDNYQRGHATGYYDDIGVLVLGDFEPRLANLFLPNSLNENQKQAMEILAKWLCYEYDLPIIETGEVSAPISTHREVTETQCPGKNMAGWVENNLRNTIDNWNLGG